MREATLEASGITVHYGRVRAIHGLDITVAPGELIVLIGPNGAGKTTTLRALSGLASTTAGRVMIGDTDLTGAPPERFAAAGVTHIPEGRGIFGRLSVEQNVLMGLYPRRARRPDRRLEVGRALEAFPELVGRRAQRASTLSGGEQQMLAMARAIATEPSFLLLDEPSRGLAPRVASRLFELIDERRSAGLGVCLSEQHVTTALDRADRVLMLERGVVTYQGEAAGLQRRRLERAYLGGGP